MYTSNAVSFRMVGESISGDSVSLMTIGYSGSIKNGNDVWEVVYYEAADNVIETIKVNGTILTPDGSKAVNIDLSGYDKAPLIIEVDDTDTTVPSGTYASITTALSNGRKVFVKVNIDQGEGNTDYCILPLVEKFYIEGDEDSYYFSNY